MQTQRLMSYDATAQHLGTWLLGFDWNIYGCLTFSKRVGEAGAQIFLKHFIERLDRKLHAPTSYYAVLEHRFSGCGYSPIPYHWHLLAANTNSADLASRAKTLWERSFGWAKIERYDPDLDGAFYVSKLVAHPNGLAEFGNLDRLNYRGPSDLIAAARDNPYVPAHLKDKVQGQFLTVR